MVKASHFAFMLFFATITMTMIIMTTTTFVAVTMNIIMICSGPIQDRYIEVLYRRSSVYASLGACMWRVSTLVFLSYHKVMGFDVLHSGSVPR